MMTRTTTISENESLKHEQQQQQQQQQQQNGNGRRANLVLPVVLVQGQPSTKSLLGLIMILSFITIIVPMSSSLSLFSSNTNIISEETSNTVVVHPRDLVMTTEESSSSSTTTKAIKYKFTFDECIGMTIEECQTFIKEQVMPYNVLHDVTLDISPLKKPLSKSFMKEPQDVYIQVNTKGQVLGGGKTSRLDEPLNAYNNNDDSDFVITGHVDFKHDGHTYGQPCDGLSYDHCCRNVQRSYQRRIHMEQGGARETNAARIEEEINLTNLIEFDKHCYKEVISPLAEIYETSFSGIGRDSIVSFQEYIYDWQAKTFKLEYIDEKDVIMTVPLKVDAETNVVNSAPRINARMALNPKHEFFTSYLTSNEGNIKSSQMNIVGESTTSSSLDNNVILTSLNAYMSLNVVLGLLGISGFCFCFVYMCCIPIKDADDFSLDGSNSCDNDDKCEVDTMSDSEGKYSGGGSNNNGINNINTTYPYTKQRYMV